MRLVATVFMLGLAVSPTYGQVPCVDGMVVVRLSSAQVPSNELFTQSPALFGVSSIDDVLAPYVPTGIELFMDDLTGAAQTPAVDRLSRTYIVYYSDDEDPNAVVADLLANSSVEAAFVNARIVKHYAATKTERPTDTEFSSGRQWNLDFSSDDRVDIDAPEAWAIETGDPNLVIGIIDVGTMIGIYPSGFTEGPYTLHPDNAFFINTSEDNYPDGLGPEDIDDEDSTADEDLWPDNVIGRSFAPIPNNVTDPFERLFWRMVPHNWTNGAYLKHGVWVASIAAAKAVGGSNIAGVANTCQVYVLRDGTDVQGSTMVDEGNALELAAKFSDVINMSWAFQGPPLDPLTDAFEFAIDRDCVLVAAAGNIGQGWAGDSVGWPCQHPDILCVGSISSSLQRDSYSRYGPTVGLVDAVAPVGPVGVGIPANSHNDCTPPCDVNQEVEAHFSGTSAAAPQASGVAALVRSRFPGMTQEQVRHRIEKSAEWYWGTSPADSLDVKMYGRGKINAYRALSEWGSVVGSVVWTKNELPPYLQQNAWVSRPGSRDGMYYISGDLTIEEGATLTIAAGTVVRVAPDHEELGADPDRVQIIVRGTLNIVGDAGNPVVFESFKEGATGNADWLGIRFEAGSSGSISHASFKNASCAIESYTTLTGANAVTDCAFTGCGTAIEAHANVTATGTLIANNDVAVDIYSGTTTLTKCTLADNATSATVTRTGTSLSVSKCVTALNGGPAVRALSGGTGNATMDSSVVYQNGASTGSRTDAQWETDGTVVHNINPAFCDAANGVYHLYAYSPAAAASAAIRRIFWRTGGCTRRSLRSRRACHRAVEQSDRRSRSLDRYGVS